MTRTILVTGAAGFMGGHLLARLRANGDARIIGFDVRAPSADSWDAFIKGDVTNRDEVITMLRQCRPDEIYHLAGITHGSCADLTAVNLLGTRHVLEAVASYRPGAALVVAGSAAEYGKTASGGRPLTEDAPCEPAGDYGRTKHAAALEVLGAAATGLRANVVRPFNVVGAGVPETLVVGAIVARLRQVKLRAEPTLQVGNLDSARDFVDVGDVAQGMVMLARSGLAGKVFNLCSGRSRSIRDLAVRLARIAQVDAEIVPDPALAGVEGIAISVGSHAAATAAFGFRPGTPLSDSLTAAWEGSAAAVAPT